MNEQQTTVTSRLKVFYSYARKDKRLRQRLENHLTAMRQQGMISEWYDHLIAAGIDWAHEIDEHLMEASVILLLISSDFLASEHCYSIEMRRALERHEVKDACVIPILLRPVDWQDTPFAHLQCLPSNGRPVTTWSNRDAAFLDIARGIRRAIEEIRASSPTTVHSSLPSRILPTTLRHQDEMRCTPQTKERQNRQRLLRRVYAFWIAGVLEQSLYETIFIPQDLQLLPGAVANPLGRGIEVPAQPLPPETRILQIYDDVDGELLILGEPGTGKTTLMLELARDLISRATQDASQSMPIVFNLSSWAESRQPLNTWLIEELNARYQVPRLLAQSWVNDEEILDFFPNKGTHGLPVSPLIG